VSRRTREQERARHAYACAEKVLEEDRAAYKALANGFGAFVLKNGLAGALAFVERGKSDKANGLFLDHLATANLPALAGKKGAGLFAEVRGLEVADYMLVTREILALTVWLRRAVQATFVKGEEAGGAGQTR
jgi:CRISPR type III-B/RAMP module-associated protein Cmr5